MIGVAYFPINTFVEECDNIILKDGKEISAKVLEVMSAMLTTTIKHIIGFGDFNSVACGAKMVIALAKSWQVPMAVARISEGNKV